jgi:hypothetical protein
MTQDGERYGIGKISRKGHLHRSGEDVLNAGHRNLLGNV